MIMAYDNDVDVRYTRKEAWWTILWPTAGADWSRDGTSTAFAEYESSPSTGNLKSSPSTSTSLRYSSTSPSTAFRYSSTDSSTRAPVLESVLESFDLTSRNIPVSFFLHVQIRQGTSGSREGKILLQDSQVTSLLTYWRNCGTIYFTIYVTGVRIKESQSRWWIDGDERLNGAIMNYYRRLSL